MYGNAVNFALRLSRALVVFDIEHTGGTKDNRAITEFGAIVLEPSGQMRQYESLVCPPVGTRFEPFVSKLTGIYPSTVADAPPWKTVMQDFVLPHLGAVWVGYNSRSSDMPIIRAECRREGVELGDMRHLDLMRVGTTSGSLTKRVAQLLPGYDTSKAHRAVGDALMTLALMNVELPAITDTDLMNQGLLTLGMRRQAATTQ